MSSCSAYAFPYCSWNKPNLSTYSSISCQPKASLSSLLQPLLRNFRRSPKREAPKLMIEQTSRKLLDAFVDRMFHFANQPYLSSQSNFRPVDEIGEAVQVINVEGHIPDDFPEGVYLRIGSNPVHGGLISTESIFGKSSEIWVEGEGMIHAIYFTKLLESGTSGNWTIAYNNKYVQTESFKLEKETRRPLFLPAAEGDPLAVLLGFFLNMMRFGMVNKDFSNTNIFEHSGKYYTNSEYTMPTEIDIHTLETLGKWNEINRAWNRPFTSHPKKVPETGDLVTFGFDAQKPYMVLGVILGNSMKLVHKVDLKYERAVLCHEIGVTRRFNVIMDFPVTVDLVRVLTGGSLLKYVKDYARIGVMPRYGDATSMNWFGVETCSVFHIINCYEQGDEVVVMACRADESIIPGPEFGIKKTEWFSRGFKHNNSIKSVDDDEGFLFARPYEWRLNLRNQHVKGRYLVEPKFSQDFPMINEKFTGMKNKYAYTQIVDSSASSAAAQGKYSGLAKLYLQEKLLNQEKNEEEFIKIEYHMLPENTFCSGFAFVAKDGAVEEDGGWLVTFVHNESTNISEVYIIDAKSVSAEPIARITLPSRVPYGFHGVFMPFGLKHTK